jgi:hypothetical protein
MSLRPPSKLDAPKPKQESHSPEPESVKEYLARINGQLVKLDEISKELKQQTKQMRTISRRTDIIAVIILIFFLLAVLYSCDVSLSSLGNIP